MYGTTLTIKELAELVRAVKEDIDDDTMSVSEYDGAGFNGEEPRPSIDLTIGYNPESGDWSFQTGDNSFMGAAYHYPFWGVTTVYRRSNSRQLARDLIEEIADQIYQ